MEIKNNKGEVIANINLTEGISLSELISAISPKKAAMPKLGKLLKIKEDPSNRKFVVFDFGTASLRYSLPEKKFCKDNGVFLSKNSINLLPINKAELESTTTSWSKHSDFWIKLRNLTEEKWLKTFFTIMDIWANGKQNGESRMLYLSDRDKLSRCKIIRLTEDKAFLDCVESLSKIPQIQEMDDDALSRFYNQLVTSSKNPSCYRVQLSLSKLSLDAWFLERSNKSLASIYRDGDEEVLGENIAAYLKASALGLKNMFQYAFDTHKGVLRLHSMDKIKDLIKKYNYDERRLADYLMRDVYYQGLELSDSQYGSSDAIGMLYDYAKMNKDMDKDFDKYPKYLSTYHDIAQKNYEVKKDELLKKKFKKIVENLKNDNIEFSNNVYSIVLPKSSKDLIKEGQTLSHCVASYYNRMAAGETTIVFLRKIENIDKSLVTLEIRNENDSYHLIQAKSFRNSAPEKAEKEFIDNYMDYLNKKV